ncbi:hypothetical protein [Streptomyces phaeoluteigriseus]
MTNTVRASDSTSGCLPASADAPQVKAALRLLTDDGQPLAVFAPVGACVSGGAYLDPRRDTGEVVLAYCGEDGKTTNKHERDERELTTREYAGLFRAAGWSVNEYRENDQAGTERLARLILTPPPTPWPVDAVAMYVPDSSEDYRDVVIIQSLPEGATVEALSARKRKIIRVPLDKLQPLPEVEPLRGEPTDWWRVLNKEGQFIVRVHAETFDGAVAAAAPLPAARQALKRDGGLYYRRLTSWQLSDADQ